MELLGLVILLLFVGGAILLATRGVFARDLEVAQKRVQQREQELQEQAGTLEERLRQMEREYHVKLKRAEQEAQKVLEDAKQQAMNIRTVAIDEAKHRARQVLLEVDQHRSQLRTDVAGELAAQLARRAGALMRELLPQAELAALHRRLVRELLDTLQELDVRTIREQVERIEVGAALPLEAPELQAMAAWATERFGPGKAPVVQMEPGLIAGCVVRLGPTTVDSSFLTRLQRAERVA